MNTDEDFNIKFVQIIKKHRCLYDKKVPEYRNKDFQEKSWIDIARDTRESVSHCKERWRNLRACLSRYIKQQSSLDPQHKPYYLIEYMQFLLPFLKPPRSVSINTNNNNNSIIANSNNNETNSCSSSDLHLEDVKSYFYNPPQGRSRGRSPDNNSPIASETDTASVNYVPPPEVQIEMRTDDTNSEIHPMVFIPNNENYRNSGRHGGNSSGDDRMNERKRIKLEENLNGFLPHRTATCSFSENTDMDFFRSILPDIDGMTSQQKRKFKIGVLELIDDIFTKYPDKTNTGQRCVNGGY